ncbi:MAG: hypothetical protein H6888_03365 [Nitratireductor sp.]|nr:hypothetical protein [Nitratireductor sp.]
MPTDLMQAPVSTTRDDIDPAEIASELGTPVRLKTWSLIVTFFGDAVLPRGGSVSAVSLGQVMERMGVEPGAVRTAVSRLASDGWIERNREGRASFYRLAPYREQSIVDAGRRIYAPAGAAAEKEEGWALASLPSDMEPERLPRSMIALQKGWYLIGPDMADRPSSMMVFQGNFEQKPAWFMEMLAPQAQAEAMERLMEIFYPVLQSVQQGWKPQPVDALALRCLLIHDWRRIVLRLNALPASLLPEDWPEGECRKMVAELYQGLLAPSEAWLSTVAQCEAGHLPAAKPFLFDRFRASALDD